VKENLREKAKREFKGSFEVSKFRISKMKSIMETSKTERKSEDMKKREFCEERILFYKTKSQAQIGPFTSVTNSQFLVHPDSSDSNLNQDLFHVLRRVSGKLSLTNFKF